MEFYISIRWIKFLYSLSARNCVKAKMGSTPCGHQPFKLRTTGRASPVRGSCQSRCIPPELPITSQDFPLPTFTVADIFSGRGIILWDENPWERGPTLGSWILLPCCVGFTVQQQLEIEVWTQLEEEPVDLLSL